MNIVSRPESESSDATVRQLLRSRAAPLDLGENRRISLALSDRGLPDGEGIEPRQAAGDMEQDVHDRVVDRGAGRDHGPFAQWRLSPLPSNRELVGATAM